jgi:surface antigen
LSEISNEELMAYADGELADDVRIRVEAYLADDPNAQKRLAVFTATGRNLADLFDRPMHEPVPARLIHGIVASSDDAGASQIVRPPDAKVVPLQSRRRPLSMGMPARALAASLAGVLVAGSSIWFLKNASPDAQSTFGLASANAEKIAGDGLASALETVPSGKTAERTIASETASIRPTFSFATLTSSYCRQYDIFRQNLIGLTGVACRQPNGSWRIEIQMPSAVHRSSGDAVVPAGKADLTPVEAIVDGLISGDVLGPDDEARAINGGWRQAPR